MTFSRHTDNQLLTEYHKYNNHYHTLQDAMYNYQQYAQNTDNPLSPEKLIRQRTRVWEEYLQPLILELRRRNITTEEKGQTKLDKYI